jgi:hypothetical protein
MPKKTNWNAIEQRIRNALSEYRNGDELAVVTLRVIDELLADTTRRGNELPAESMSWESSDIPARALRIVDSYRWPDGDKPADWSDEA